MFSAIVIANGTRIRCAFPFVKSIGRLAMSSVSPFSSLVPIVFEDDHIVVINKPSGMLSVAGRDRMPKYPRYIEWRMAIEEAAKCSSYSQSCIGVLQQLPSAKIELSRNKNSFMKQIHRFCQDEMVKQEVWTAVHSTDASMHRISLESLPPHRRSALQILEITRPHARPVHRLDCETSGVMVVAKNESVAAKLATIFRTRKVNKTYTAIVDGVVSPSVTSIDLPLYGAFHERPKQRVDYKLGKPSQTLVSVQRSYKIEERDVTEVQLTPVTGRTHQLRLHMSSIGHAILGDTLYAPNDVMLASKRLELHAMRLQFRHPYSAEEIDITVPKLPPLFDNDYLIANGMICGGEEDIEDDNNRDSGCNRKKARIDEEQISVTGVIG